MSNLTHVMDENKERQQLQYEPSLSVFIFLKWDFFSWLHTVDSFDSAVFMHVEKEECIQPKLFSHGSLHLYALARRRAGAPLGDPKPEGTGWCCTGLLAITTMVKTEWSYWRYYWSGVGPYLTALLVKCSISEAERSRTLNNTKTVQTLHLWLWSF